MTESTTNRGRNSQHQAALGWAKLPAEIKIIIAQYAMIARDSSSFKRGESVQKAPVLGDEKDLT